MICYLDRAFCNASLRACGEQRCINSECSRCLTDEHVARARKWWGGDGAPISVMKMKTDTCGYQPSNEWPPAQTEVSTTETME